MIQIQCYVVLMLFSIIAILLNTSNVCLMLGIVLYYVLLLEL